MVRATRSIQLVLIGSACVLLGCRDSTQQAGAPGTQPAHSGGTHYVPHPYFSSRSRSWSGGTGSSTGAHGTVGRGGFGSSGHLAGS